MEKFFVSVKTETFMNVKKERHFDRPTVIFKFTIRSKNKQQAMRLDPCEVICLIILTLKYLLLFFIAF